MAEKIETLAAQIVAYMEAKKYTVFRGTDQVNIVYLEGSNEDGTPNADAPDGWNDRRIVIVWRDGKPEIVHNAPATTEPGIQATNSLSAQRRGGVARIQFGQFTAWRMFYHQYAKFGPLHPALVQCAPLKVHRDANKDGKRTGDPLDWAQGINQHSTRPNMVPGRVQSWSEGCLVCPVWGLHEQFIALCKADPRYIADDQFVFTTTIIAGDDFAKKKQK